MTVVKSVSLTEEENDFLLLHNLSPSGLLKQRIKQVREFHEQFSKERFNKVLNLLKETNKKLLLKEDEVEKLKRCLNETKEQLRVSMKN